MPAYDVAAVAEALHIPDKTLDNILSRHSLPGVERTGRRGIARRIAPEAVVALRLALDFMGTVRVPIAAALDLARMVLERDGTAQAGPFAMVTVDLHALRSSTFARLDGAVEAVGRRVRGRPPATSGGDASIF